MSYDEFKKKYLGKFVDFDGVYSAQCVDLVKQWISDNGWPMKRGNAIDWVKNADDFYRWVENTPQAVPVQGDIIIFRVGAYGHIGIVEHGNTSTVDVLNQNWPNGNTTDPVVVTRFNYVKPQVVGWLHPVAIDNKPKTEVASNQDKETISSLSASLASADRRIAELNEAVAVLTKEKNEALGIVEANRIQMKELSGKIESLQEDKRRAYEQMAELEKKPVSVAKTASLLLEEIIKKVKAGGMAEKLGSRKLWIAVLTAIIFILNNEYNQALAVIMTYLGVQGFVDYNKS